MTIHVLPVSDEVEHIESPSCWCKPRIEEDGQLVIHTYQLCRIVYQALLCQARRGENAGEVLEGYGVSVEGGEE
jgi:hypothetical protein